MLAIRISAALSAEWLIPSRCRSAAALAELSQQQVWQRLTSVWEKKKQQEIKKKKKEKKQTQSLSHHSLIVTPRIRLALHRWWSPSPAQSRSLRSAAPSERRSTCPQLALMYSQNRLFIGQSMQETSRAPPRASPSFCVWVTPLQSFLQMDVWPDHRGHAEHKLSALAAGDANALGRAQRGVKQKSAVRGDLWDNGAAFRK